MKMKKEYANEKKMMSSNILDKVSVAILPRLMLELKFIIGYYSCTATS